MRKFIIKDETGKQYDITEQCIDEEPASEKAAAPAPELKDEEVLSSEEIVALKKLAASADKLIALIADEVSTPEIKDEEEPKKSMPDADELVVIDTDPVEAKDSVGSIGTKANDSAANIVDSQLDIADAWNKRFNNVHKGE